jgi:hypothetical protein
MEVPLTRQAAAKMKLDTDIEDRKHAQSKLEQLVDAVPKQLVVLRGAGKRLYANKAARYYHFDSAQGPVSYSEARSRTHPDELQLSITPRPERIEPGLRPRKE